ncbi:HNH endonuclease [Halorussus halobius]|uniref:HNH endonuclease n=1 Tax=Halorussus halobius TaxID=1710537 RepID=UPI0010931962|nr:HNH endonuclease [Halorussus halobius]
MRLEQIDIKVGERLSQADFKEVFDQGVTGKGIEIRYDEKGQKYIWLFAKEEGRYNDDLGTEQFRFTGEDPQGHGVEDPKEENQELKRGNEALRNAIDTPVPIFLFYQSVAREGWEYRGMVEVISFEYKSDNGRYIYEFLLEPVEGDSEIPSPLQVDNSEQSTDTKEPPQTQSTVSRIVRNTALVKELKGQYEYTCQVCGDQRRRNNGEPYAEGHHIRPLGKPHNGADKKSNILVLCPNHHADFDFGRIRIDPQTFKINHAYESKVDGTELRRKKEHDIDERCVRYHNEGIVQF